MNAVGIDVSKGKSTVTIRRPGDRVILKPCDFRHTQSDINSLIGIIKGLDGETHPNQRVRRCISSST